MVCIAEIKPYAIFRKNVILKYIDGMTICIGVYDISIFWIFTVYVCRIYSNPYSKSIQYIFKNRLNWTSEHLNFFWTYPEYFFPKVVFNTWPISIKAWQCHDGLIETYRPSHTWRTNVICLSCVNGPLVYSFVLLQRRFFLSYHYKLLAVNTNLLFFFSVHSVFSPYFFSFPFPFRLLWQRWPIQCSDQSKCTYTIILKERLWAWRREASVIRGTCIAHISCLLEQKAIFCVIEWDKKKSKAVITMMTWFSYVSSSTFYHPPCSAPGGWPVSRVHVEQTTEGNWRANKNGTVSAEKIGTFSSNLRCNTTGKYQAANPPWLRYRCE